MLIVLWKSNLREDQFQFTFIVEFNDYFQYFGTFKSTVLDVQFYLKIFPVHENFYEKQ